MRLLLIYGFLIFSLCTSGQDLNELKNILYIVDSIPVIDDPDEGLGTLNGNDIDNIVVVKSKDTLQKIGYGNLDGVIYIFTKEYINRPSNLKRIPTTKLMERKDGIWYLKGSNTPYSGPFIDYYLTGKKEGEGNFKDGVVDGLRIMYFPNGNINVERNYKSDIRQGIAKEFYNDGTLKQQGEFVNGLEEGKWKMYFPNGKIKQTNTFNKGEMVGESFTYYSSGKLKFATTIKDGKTQFDETWGKINKFYKRGNEDSQLGNFKSAINQYSKCLELDSLFSDAYFARGTAKLNNFQFDQAIIDFNKAIQIEPYYFEAHGNRAFCRIRKYQFADSKILSNTSEVTVLSSKDNVTIPADELIKICYDLSKAIEFGDKSKMIKEAYEQYCKK